MSEPTSCQPWNLVLVLLTNTKLVTLFEHKDDEKTMTGEILNAAILSFGLILVGIALGFLLLKIQGGEE